MSSLSRPATLAVSALLSLAVASALAQEPPAAVATAPATAPAPTSAPAQGGAETQATPATTVSKRVSFNFKDASVDAFLNYFAESLGFIIIKDARIDARVTISSPHPVTAEEAVDVINSVLRPYKYTAVQTGRVLRIMSFEKSNTSNIPVHIGADPATIKDDDERITQVIPLVQLDAVRLRTDLTALFSPDAVVTANATSNTIIITDMSSNIRRIVEVISAMDHQKVIASDVQVFHLKYASATATAKLITDIFTSNNTTNNANQAGGGRGRFFGAFFGRGGGPGGPGGPGGAGGAAETADAAEANAVKVVASADDRTNSVVVTGPTETLAVVADVVKKLDSDTTEATTFFIYSLKNGNAQNLQVVLNSMFSGSGSTGTTSQSTNGFTPFGGSSSSFGSSGSSRSGGSSFGSSSFGSSSFGSSGSSRSSSVGGGTFGGGRFGSSGSSSSTSNQPNADLIGQVLVVAEPDTNSLLVTTSAKYKDRVQAIIAELDRDVPQVLIKVLVAEVTRSDDSNIGIEYSVLNKRPSGNGSSGGTAFGIASSLANAAATGTPSGLVASVVESNVTAALQALATTGKLDVLSRPSILASDNQLASIMVGQSVPIVTASNITSVGTIVNTVQYQSIGIILNVTPHINPEGIVILDVAPQVSELTGQTVTIQAGVSAPVFSLIAAQSRVAIKNGQTIIIGGLMQDQITQTINKIPLLGDIPVAGALFSQTTKQKAKTELLFFITPIVAFQPAALKPITAAEQGGTQVINSAVAPGVFQYHMEGMQRGVETQPAATQPAATAPAVTPK